MFNWIYQSLVALVYPAPIEFVPQSNSLTDAINFNDMLEIRYWLNKIKEADEEESGIQFRIHFILWYAIARGKLYIVKYILANIIDVNSYSSCHLSTAVECNHINIVNELIRVGANVNKVVDKSTALKEASVKGYTDIMKVLINAGADVNAPGVEILSTTAWYSKHDALKLLLDHGAVINELTREYMYVISHFDTKSFAILQSHDTDWFLPLAKVSTNKAKSSKCGICLFPCKTKYICCGAPVHRQCGEVLINVISGENAEHYCYNKCNYSRTLHDK